MCPPASGRRLWVSCSKTLWSNLRISSQFSKFCLLLNLTYFLCYLILQFTLHIYFPNISYNSGSWIQTNTHILVHELITNINELFLKLKTWHEFVSFIILLPRKTWLRHRIRLELPKLIVFQIIFKHYGKAMNSILK